MPFQGKVRKFSSQWKKKTLFSRATYPDLKLGSHKSK